MANKNGTIETGILIVKCCYCNKWIGIKSSKGAPGGVSHGICEECFLKLKTEIEKMEKKIKNE